MSEDLQRDEWTLAEVLDLWRDSLQNELHTALPGKVESYDAATQRGDVTPQIKRALVDATGAPVFELLPTIRNVPIVQPRAGGYFLHAPVTAGDTVLLLVCERDVSRWLQTGEVSETPDLRLHDLSNAVALTGFYPSSSPITPAPSAGDLELGREANATRITITGSTIQCGGSAQLARFTQLEAHLDAIAADLDAIASAAMTTAANYGALAKAALDVSQPIATDVVRGDAP